MHHHLDRGTQSKPTSGSSNTALAVRSVDMSSCANLNCKAKKRLTHTTTNCYWLEGGKEGQFLPNFGQWVRANAASSNPVVTEHFVLSTRVSDVIGPTSDIVIDDDDVVSTMALVSKNFSSFCGRRIPTFIDLGASDTMFVSKDDFAVYKTVTPRSGDSAKAVNGDFEIIGKGTVIKRYIVDGREKKITYTRAIHTPMLNANLISVSTFDRAGLSVVFGGGRSVVQKPDGTVVLTARCEKRMYIVNEVNDNLPEVSQTPLVLRTVTADDLPTLPQPLNTFR